MTYWGRKPNQRDTAQTNKITTANKGKGIYGPKFDLIAKIGDAIPRANGYMMEIERKILEASAVGGKARGKEGKNMGKKYRKEAE